VPLWGQTLDAVWSGFHERDYRPHLSYGSHLFSSIVLLLNTRLRLPAFELNVDQ
jgi:hypothetical protein